MPQRTRGAICTNASLEASPLCKHRLPARPFVPVQIGRSHRTSNRARLSGSPVAARVTSLHGVAGSSCNCCALRRATGVIKARRVVCLAAQPDLPLTPAQLASNSCEQFLREASQPDGRVNMGKACLLLGLEEQAAWGAHMTQYWDMEGAPANIKRTFRSDATASTWSLERLDGIAAEAASVFRQKVGLDSDGGTSLGKFAAQYPMQLLEAINTVLFERHGYYHTRQFGDMRDMDFSSVLETGQGSAAVICILYTEVSSRLGLPLATYVLEEGRYLMLGPDPPECLSLHGQPLMVDAFGGGSVFTRQEVCELFDVDEQQLQPASQQQVLVSVLNTLQNAHWARGVGCRPEPALMTPLSIDTALQGSTRITGTNYHIKRALAAAGKARELLPHCRRVQLDLALLLYFDGRWEDTWLELGLLLSDDSSSDTSKVVCIDDDMMAQLEHSQPGARLSSELAKVPLLMEKSRLLIEFGLAKA